MIAPDIHASTKEERFNYIKEKYKCISNCESCGLCIIFKGKDPLIVFKEYIEGNIEYSEIQMTLR